jgi:hypothetical protein
MTQPWDYWHVSGGGELNIYNTREIVESAGIIGTGGSINYAPQMLSARPFFVGDEGITITDVSVNLNSSTSQGTCRFGIYSCPPPAAHDMYPSELVADLGELTLSGSFRPSLAVTPVELEPGFYYIATIFNNTAAASTVGYAHTQLGGPGFPLGYAPANGTGLIGFSVYRPYGPLPAAFPPLVTGSYGVGIAGNNTAIYVEAAVATFFQVSWNYNSATPAGTAVVATDTTSQVAVNYGNNTSPATVAAALQSAANITTAISVGSPTNLLNSGSSGLIQLQLAGPLQTLASGVGAYLPVTAIAVEPAPPVVGGAATGGIVADVVIGDFTWRTHTFTSSDNFSVTTSITSCEYLIVGGGGGGGASQGTSSWASGGGGGGGFARASGGFGIFVNTGTFPVVIGTGGAGGLPNTAAGASGTSSSWNSIVANGGTGGGAYSTHTGGSSNFSGGIGGGAPNYGGGGGGGSGAAGTNGTGTFGGAGGAGVTSSINGTISNYSGGGGGGVYGAGIPGNGGTGGGGAGAPAGINNNGIPGTNGTGGGGGGASTSSASKAGAISTGGRGGDGIVIIRYPIA